MITFISDKTMAERYEIGRSTVWHWVSTGKLPKPHRLTSQTTRWDLQEVEDFDKRNHGDLPDGENEPLNAPDT